MFVLISSKSIPNVVSNPVNGGTNVFRGAAFQYSGGEGDEPVALRIRVGAMTGTNPSLKVEIEGCNIGDVTSTTSFVVLFGTTALQPNTEAYLPITVPLMGKLRFKLSTNANDNAGTPDIQLLTRAFPTADANP